MVNRGRSGGCNTCKKRRVKCDEEKPDCRRCRRLGLGCGGYRRTEWKFREQNHKFGPVAHVEMPLVVDDTAVPRSPTAPDPDIAFFFEHYTGYGRSMKYARGFFEILAPIYGSQNHDSALSHAVSAMASLAFSLWRYGSYGVHDVQPRRLYSHAVISLREAITDHSQINKLETLLAVLALQWFENVVAIYGLRRPARTHHDGAISLLSVTGTGTLTSMSTSANARNFVHHIEVASAMRRKKPVQRPASFYFGIDPKPGHSNPSVVLDNTGAAIAELQASAVKLHSSSTVPQVERWWKAQAKSIDEQLLAWARNVPPQWRPISLTNSDFDASIPTYMGVCDSYPSCQIANLWNLWRIQRLLLVQFTLSSSEPTSFHDQHPSESAEETVNSESTYHLPAIKRTAQDLVDSICQSVPFYLGNRTLPSSMADFTDPNILVLPSCCPSCPQTTSLNSCQHDSTSSTQHRRHIIAQGPWHMMSPLSRLLTLFSEDAVMASLLRPGQRQWIRTQFLRVMMLLQISPVACNGAGDNTGGADEEVMADFLAKQVRKGATFMSGP